MKVIANRIKSQLLAAISLLLMTIFIQGSVVAATLTKEQTLELLVLKSPTCGCCQKWIDHLTEQGVIAHGQNTDKMAEVKMKFGVQPQYRSCHTAITRDGFVFEGHVPAKYIYKFLAEKPANAIGLSVPAMPIGSPGMEVDDKFMPYKVLVLLEDGSSKVYANVETYESQF